MVKHIILAQSEQTAMALEEFLLLAKGQYRKTEHRERLPEQIIWEDSNVDLEAYRILANDIESKASGLDGLIPVGEVVIIVDQITFTRLNPIASNSWEKVISMLILTFPEVHWVFGIINGVADTEKKSFEDLHGLLSMFETIADPIFDGTGLREWVRFQARNTTGGEACYLPERSKLAVAIDEEQNYAYVHGYAAYSFGFRTYAVTEEALMEKLLGEKGILKDNGNFNLSIEDICLNFPDRSDKHRGTHWSDLTMRSEKLPVLGHPGVLRTFVTSGQKKGMDHEKSRRNRRVQTDLQVNKRLGTMVYKPTAGIYDLWKASGLFNKLRDGHQRGQADGFYWPPYYSNSPESDTNHSAPGTLLEVATRLVTRAERLRQNAESAIRAVQGAVLAVDAMELLGEKAQTTFLEALTLKHEFEAIAECQFQGVQMHFDVKSRMKDIRYEISQLSRFFNPSPSICKEAEWNAEAAIISRLIKIYQNYNEFDEELAFQVRSRALNRRLWFKSKMGVFGDELRWANPLYWAPCYVHGLLRSIPLFSLAILLWIGVLSGLFAFASPASNSARLHKGFEDAVTSFFSVGSPTHHDEGTLISLLSSSDTSSTEERLSIIEKNMVFIYDKVNEEKYPPQYMAIICLAIIAGFIHIGIFISHLYLISSRK